jgi:hypothetical protein
VNCRLKLNGMEVIARTKTAIFVRLPKELQTSAGECSCIHCKGQEGFWDTLGIPLAKSGHFRDATWVVHMPMGVRS